MVSSHFNKNRINGGVFIRGNRFFIGGLILLALGLGFQNCSSLNSGVSGTSRSSGPDGAVSGNGGYDGKIFQTFALCATTGKVDVANVIRFTADQSKAALIKKNCQDLSEPSPIDLGGVQFSSEQAVLTYQGAVFDQKSSGSTQQVTLQLCQSPPGATTQAQLRIWEVLGQATALYGEVAESGGADSGVLLLQASLPSASEFISASGQSSQFDLKVLSKTLTYSISGGAQTSESVNCVTQSAPTPTVPQPTGTCKPGSTKPLADAVYAAEGNYPPLDPNLIPNYPGYGCIRGFSGTVVVIATSPGTTIATTVAANVGETCGGSSNPAVLPSPEFYLSGTIYQVGGPSTTKSEVCVPGASPCAPGSTGFIFEINWGPGMIVNSIVTNNGIVSASDLNCGGGVAIY